MKTKSLLFWIKGHWVFTFDICIYEGVGEDSGYGIGLVTFSSRTCRHLSRNMNVFT